VWCVGSVTALTTDPLLKRQAPAAFPGCVSLD
jgi:hypothetical protein